MNLVLCVLSLYFWYSDPSLNNPFPRPNFGLFSKKNPIDVFLPKLIFLKWKCNTQKKSTKSTLTFLDLQKLQHFGLWLTSKFAISLCLLWYALIQGKNLFLSKIFCTTFWSFLQVLWMLWIRKSCQNIFETFYQYALCGNLTIF